MQASTLDSIKGPIRQLAEYDDAELMEVLLTTLEHSPAANDLKAEALGMAEQHDAEEILLLLERRNMRAEN